MSVTHRMLDEPRPCPTCGHCPTCGRTNQQFSDRGTTTPYIPPLVPYAPYVPYVPPTPNFPPIDPFERFTCGDISDHPQFKAIYPYAPDSIKSGTTRST